MRTLTRLSLYAAVGAAVALNATALLAGLACVLLIEVLFRPSVSANVSVQRPTVTPDEQRKLAELAREAARRAIRMRES